RAVAGMALEGDASFGRRRRQVLLIEEEVLLRLDLRPGLARENVVVRGLPLAPLPAGTRLMLGEAVLEVTGACSPCDYLEGLRPGLREAMRGQRGTLGRVVVGGAIQLGDVVRVIGVAEPREVEPGQQHD
ncbi:MAG: MOSC domain-containing protein, partial [Chloroflexota bacterium]